MTTNKRKAITAKKSHKYAGRMAGIKKMQAAIKKENNLYNRKIISAARKLRIVFGSHRVPPAPLTPKEYCCIVELASAAVDKVKLRGAGGSFSYKAMRYRLGINVLGQVTIYFAGESRPFICTDFGTIP